MIWSSTTRSTYGDFGERHDVQLVVVGGVALYFAEEKLVAVTRKVTGHFYRSHYNDETRIVKAHEFPGGVPAKTKFVEDRIHQNDFGPMSVSREELKTIAYQWIADDVLRQVDNMLGV